MASPRRYLSELARKNIAASLQSSKPQPKPKKKAKAEDKSEGSSPSKGESE